jgi:serine acetyltransferase
MMRHVSRTSPAGFRRSVYADYEAFYAFRGESPARLRALAALRILTNPSMHAVILLRIAACSPRPLDFVWRNILISKHSIDLYRKPVLGPGLMLSHPFGIVLGGVTIGEGVLLAHNVSIGSARKPRPGEEIAFPVIGDRVTINPNSVVAGAITIGDDCIIGANCVVDCDMPPGSVFARGELRLRGARGSEAAGNTAGAGDGTGDAAT